MRRSQDRARSSRSRKNGAKSATFKNSEARSATIEYYGARSATIESRALGALKLASARWECAREAGRFFNIWIWRLSNLRFFLAEGLPSFSSQIVKVSTVQYIMKLHWACIGMFIIYIDMHIRVCVCKYVNM